MGMPMRPSMSVMETPTPRRSPPTTPTWTSRSHPSAIRARPARDANASPSATPSGNPVTDLVRTHQVWAHLILTRKDAGGSARSRTSTPSPPARPGSSRSPATFPTAGTYLAHVEFRRQGSMTDVLDRTQILVPGTPPTPRGIRGSR